MSQYAIFVTVQLKPGMADQFRPHILKNAKAAVEKEADCRFFSVNVAEDDPDRFHFYEVYANKAALDFHRQQPHFLAFAQATKDMVLNKTVQGLHIEHGQPLKAAAGEPPFRA